MLASLFHPRYRADIDGLRAIAVLAVVGYHAFPEAIRGGFVGVDVFFVISGFLISSIILHSLEKGTFSLGEFYARRIKRIFPALILVMASCYAFGWFALLPDEYGQLGKHIAAGAGFVSNLFFWQEAGYFDNLAETKPLLHLWSLGVEEQFYIVWPLLLYLAWKRHIGFLIFIGMLAALSFGASIAIRHGDPVQAFYSPLTRFWELLSGGAMAYLVQHRIHLRDKALRGLRLIPARATWLNDAQSALGILLICASVMWIDKRMAFPGWWVLLPVAGAYLVISAGQHAWLNRAVLSNRLLVWFGLISYPLYLWHWPLLSFARIMESRTPSLEIRLSAVVMAVLLAWLTYRFVERPIRFGKMTTKIKIPALAIIMVAMAGLGYATYAQDGLRERMAVREVVAQADELNYKRHWDGWSRCPSMGGAKGCWILDPMRPADIMLIGDSHAGHLASGLAGYYGKRSTNVIVKLRGGCFPVFKMPLANKLYFNCDGALIDEALEDAIKNPEIKSILLSGYPLHALAQIAVHSGQMANGPRLEEKYSNVPRMALKRNADIFQQAINKTLARLVASGKQVIFIVDVPDLNFDPRECVALRPVVLPGHKLKEPCSEPRQSFEMRVAEYHRIVKEAHVAFPAVKFIDAYKYFCDASSCYGSINGELLYMSDDHLTAAGSRYLIDRIAHELPN